MNISNAFGSAFNKMKDRGWEKIYVLVDIHDTIFRGTYSKEETYEWLPYAKECLQVLTSMEYVSLILWTSTHHEEIAKYLNVFEENGIHFDMVNVNTETEDTELSSFKEKTYFNVGIDDKFGFDAENDWEHLFYYLRSFKTVRSNFFEKKS